MKTYLAGVLVAFLINLSKLVYALIAASGQRIKNIEKVGLHYNITEGQCTKQKPTWGKVAFYLFDLLVITPLLSWAYVCYFGYSLLKARITRAPLPEKIKEIQFKLSSVSLPRETVKECLNDIARFYGGEDAAIDYRNPYEDDYDKDTFIISSGDGMHDWNVHLELDKKNRNFTIISRDPDCGEHITTREYKFEGATLWARTIEAKHKYGSRAEYDIRNGVVLEQDYRERQKGSILGSPEDIEERLEKLRTETSWENSIAQGIRYFILFKHDDVLNDMPAKRFFESEHERIASGYKRLEERAKQLGGTIGKSEFMEGNIIHCESKDIPEESLAEIHGLMSANGLEKYGITYGEFSDSEQLVEQLKLYISKL